MNGNDGYHQRIVTPLLADPVFGACRHHDLARLLPHISEHQWAPGAVLWQAGDAADAAWLVVEGRVRLNTAEAGPGLCGEDSVLGWAQRASTATALTTVRALRLPREAVGKLRDSGLRERLQRVYFARLNPAAAQLAATAASGPSSAASGAVPAAGHFISPTPTSRKEAAGWLCAIVLPTLIMLQGSHWGLGVDAVMFLAILAATVVMWVFSLVDDYVPGLFALTATLALGLATPEQALAGFASDGFFLALSVLGLGAVISASGLSFRFLLWLLHHLPDRPRWREAGLMATGFLMTPLVPSINGRVALLSPLLHDMVDVLRVGSGDRAVTRLAVAGFTGVSLLSAVFLTSKSTNFVVYGLLDAQSQAAFQWLYWSLAAGAFGLMLLAAYALCVAIWGWQAKRATSANAGGNVTQAVGGTADADEVTTASDASAPVAAQITAQLGLLGPLRNREWAALSGVAVFVLGVATASVHRIHPSWIALGVLFSLLVFGVLRKDEFREKIDWPFLMYLGGLVGLTGTLNAVGLDRWLGDHLAWLGLFMRDNLGVFLLLLTLVLGVIRLVVPISATVVIAATVFMPIAATYGVNPWVIGFAVLVIGEMWFMPYQCSYYLQFRELGRRTGYDEATMLRFNLALNFARLGALYLSIPWWRQMGLL